MFWIKNKKNKYTLVNPSFTIKWGLRGYILHGHVCVMKNYLGRHGSPFYITVYMFRSTILVRIKCFESILKFGRFYILLPEML